MHRPSIKVVFSHTGYRALGPELIPPCVLYDLRVRCPRDFCVACVCTTVATYIYLIDVSMFYVAAAADVIARLKC